MIFFNRSNREDGYGAASVLGVISLVAAGGVYLQQKEASKAMSLTKAQMVRSQAELDLMSSLSVMKGLVQLDHTGKSPTIFPSPYFVDNKPASQISLALKSKNGDLWSVSGSNIDDLVVAVERNELHGLQESHWDEIASGKLNGKNGIPAEIKIFDLEKKTIRGRSFVDAIKVESSLTDSKSGSKFKKKALVKLAKPKDPECKNPGLQGVYKGLATLKLECDSVIADVIVNVKKGNKQWLEPWNGIQDNSFTSGYREIFRKDYTELGSYSMKIDVIGVEGNAQPISLNFNIVPPPPPPPPPPPVVAQCYGRKVSGYCFYRGANRQSCYSVCGSRGLSYDGNGTSWANASKGNCLAALGGGSFKYRTNISQAGCKYFSGFNSGVYVTYSQSGGSTGISGDHRACACK